MSELTDFRTAKDDFFRTGPQSPLDRQQQKTFTGLNYYPENPDLRFDLALETVEKPAQASMATSTGD
jgi:uncharacterized protein